MSSRVSDIPSFSSYEWRPRREVDPYYSINTAAAAFEEDDKGVELSDYGKLILSGGAGLTQSAGWLAKVLGAEDLGSSIEELGANAVDYWHDSLTPSMQQEISKQIIRKNEHTGEYEWGDASFATVLGMGAESLLGTAAGMGIGAGLTKTLQVFANPFGRKVLDEARKAGSKAAAKKLKLVDTVLGAGGFGTGEGLVGGISAGASVYDNIMRLPSEKLMQNPRYRQVYESTDTSLSELERHQYAADTVAKEASTAAGFESGLTTALLGAPMGAYFGRILGGARLSSTLPRAVATGAGGEAAQEFAQSGVEQLISNIQTQPFDPDLDTFEGVLNAAVGGLLAGGLLGGAMGPMSVKGARQELAEEEREKDPQAVGGKLYEQSVRTMEAAANTARNAGASGRQIFAIVGEVTAGRMNLDDGLMQLKALENEARTGEGAAEFVEKETEKKERADFKQGVMKNLRTMSRTLAGVVDDAGSPVKAEALSGVKGKDAAQVAAKNVGKAIDLVEKNRQTKFESADELLGFIDSIAETVNAGVVKEGKLTREHDVEDRYIPAAEIPQAKQQFAEKLLQMLDKGDPVRTAAFIKQKLDHEIHPYSDGVGKTGEILASWALARGGAELPVMPERGEYFENVDKTKGDLQAYTNYYASLFPGREAPEVTAKSEAPEEIESKLAESPLSPENEKPLPTPAQIEAGNYEKPQIKYQGFDIRIENPAGSVRKKTSRHGVKWALTLQDSYGYIEGTKDRDGEAIDAYVGPNPQAKEAYVVNQVRSNGDFDEHKVMLGYGSVEEALQAYRRNYPEGHPAHQSEIVAIPVEKFRQWAKSGDTLGRLRVDENGDPIPPPMGKVEQAYAGETTVDVQYQLREVDEVITSHTLEGKPVPYYPAAMQPRDRSRQASKEWIVETAGKFNPAKITRGQSLADGAPLINPDGIVESGNGRVLLLQYLYQKGTDEQYRDYLKEHAAEFGIEAEAVDSLDKPVLVRVRQTEMAPEEAVELARVANQPEVAAFSPAETAAVDAQRLPDSIWELFNPDQAGNVLAAGNDQFIRAFLQTLPAAERGRLMTADGRPTKQLADRIVAAVFHKAYRSDRILQLMAEEADPGIRNIINALTIAAPTFARARAAGDLGDLDVTVPLLDAIDVIRQSRAQGIVIKELIAQQGLFGSVDPLVGDLATFMDNNMRSAKRMGEAFNTMGGFIEREIVGAKNASLFGQERAISLRDVVRAANAAMNERYGAGAGIPQDLFSQPRAEPAFSRREPEEVTLREQAQVEETGELVEIEERASVVMRRLKKRFTMAEKIARCLS